jgi:hypothetical protein
MFLHHDAGRVAYCENGRRLRPELWRQKNRLLHHDNVPSHTSCFTREFLTTDNVTVINPPYFSLFPRLKIKLKDRHFDTVEVNEAESQSVLNTLTEQDFQDGFKNVKSAGNGACARMGTASRAMIASTPKISF